MSDKTNYNDLHDDDILHKPKKRGREFYEEKIERLNRQNNMNKTKHYCRARKKYINFQNQTKQISQISTKENLGPEWYQELSGRQIEILDGLDDYLKIDYDLGTTTNTRRAIKNLGVTTYIPRVVIRDAFISSQLYRIPFLMAVNDFVSQKTHKKHGQTSNLDKVYTTEIRILMSSILHVAYPCLLKKLDYCLSKPVPDEKLKYLKPKSKNKNIYIHPYLEPLPEPVQPWTELERIRLYNEKIDKLMMREALNIDKQKELHDIELDIERKTSMKMNITYPGHPLEKMFYGPPLRAEFKRQNNTNNYTCKTMTDISEEVISENTSSNDDESMGFKQTPIEEPIDIKYTAVGNNILLNSGSSTMDMVKIPPAALTSTNVQQSSSTIPSFDWESYVSDEESQTLPYGWLNYNKSVSHISIGSTSMFSLADEENTNEKSPEIKIDIPHDCHSLVTTGNLENGIGTAYDGCNDLMCSSKLQEFDFPTMDENEQKLWQTFQKRNGGVVVRWPLDEQPSEITICTDITVNGIVRNKHATQSMTTLPRTPPPSLNADKTDKSASDGESGVGATPLVKKMSLHDFQSPEFEGETDGTKNVAFPASELLSSLSHANNALHTATVDADCPQLVYNDEDGSPLYLDGIIAELQEIPPWVQLKVKQTKIEELMDKSMAAWKVPRSKMTSIVVPDNPIKGKNEHTKKVTWDQINDAMNKIKKTKMEYTTKLKHVAIANARELYSITYNEYFDNLLGKYYKRTFFDYFPAKVDDCLFDYVASQTTTKNVKRTAE